MKHCAREYTRQFQRDAYIFRKNCMSAFLYESNTVSRMKIDQTCSITNTRANIRTCHIGEQLTLDPQNNFLGNNDAVLCTLSLSTHNTGTIKLHIT